MKPKPANTPLEQIYENEKDIDELKQYIAPLFNCSIDLSNNSDSVSVSNTNLDGTQTKALIIDINGNLYKLIAFNEDKTTAYIEFYSNIKGPQGEEGPEGPEGPSADPTILIDDSAIALNKTWSSNKINSKIDLISDKGIYYTTTQPTLDNGVYILNVSDLGNNNTYTWQKYGDLIIYIDGNGNPTELWKCVALNGTHDVMTVEKIADYAKGKQLYTHNIRFEINKTNADYYVGSALIINDYPLQYDYNTLASYLYDLGYTSYTNYLGGSFNGTCKAGSDYGAIIGFYYKSAKIGVTFVTSTGIIGGLGTLYSQDLASVYNFSDSVKPV